MAPVLVLSTLCACAVRPQPDYDRAGALVRGHTGSPDAYDPATDAMIRERVTHYLEGGLTAEEAVQVALLNNPEFQSLFAQIGASRADVVQSGLLSNPIVAFSVLFPEGGGRSKLNGGFTQELVDLWQIPVRKKVAAAELDRVVFEAVQRGIDIAGQVRINYYRALAFAKAEEYAIENVAIIDRSLAISEKRVRNGETSSLDANLVRATWTEAQLDVLNAKRDRQVALAALAQTLGISRWSQPWQLSDELPNSATPIANDADLLVTGLVERMDAQAKVRQIDAARNELTRQYLNIVPSVQVGAGYERPDTRGVPGRSVLADTARTSIAAGALTAPTIDSRGQRAILERQIVDFLSGPSIQVTVPLFDQNQARIARANFLVEQRRKELESLLDLVADQIQEAAATARIAAQQVAFYEKEILPLARSNLQAAEQAYAAGTQDQLVVLDAQQFLVIRRRAYVSVLREYAVAYASLERAVGGRMPSTTTTQPTTQASQVN